MISKAVPESQSLMQEVMAITFVYMYVLVNGIYMNLPLPFTCFAGKPMMQANRKFSNYCPIQAAQTDNIPIHDTSCCFGNC